MRQVRRPGRVRARLRRAARPGRRARGPCRRARARRDQPHGRDGQGRVLPARVRRQLLPQVAVRRRLLSRGGQGRPRRLHPGLLPRDPQALLRGLPAAGRRPHPGLAAGQARLLLVRHLRGLHQAGGAGREDGHRPGQPQDAAHPRRRVHPRLRDRPRRRERPGHHRAAAAEDRPRRRGHRQAHRRPRRRRVLPPARHRRHPRRRPSVPAREERPRHPQRDVQRGRRRPLQRGRDHQRPQGVPPRQDGRHVPHGHAAPLRLRRRQPGRQHAAGQHRQRSRTSSGRTTASWPSTRPSRST